MKKSLVCIIYGGKSSEYEVSLASAYSVLEEIDKEKYEIMKIGISREGKWYLYEGENDEILNDNWQEGAKEIALDINDGAFILEGEKIKPDKVLPILHGEYGEDGRIQSLFDIAGISYVGCGAFSSFLCMDKCLTKVMAKKCGVNISRGFNIFKHDEYEKIKRKVTKMGYPVVVKPSKGGSSIGVNIVKNECQLRKALMDAFSVCECVLIEEKINGKEIELAVIEREGKSYFSALGEISYTSEFYDYDEKYKNGKTEYIIPAKISKKAEKKLCQYASKLYTALGIKDVCRMDFFVTKNGRVYFNEVNTMPGFTKISMLPKLLMHDGFSYSDIINYILNI